MLKAMSIRCAHSCDARSGGDRRELYTARGRRQAGGPGLGRDDRQSRLERHLVHGHQDPQDGGEGVPGQQRQPAHGDDVAGRTLCGHRRHPRQQGVHHRRQDAAAGEGDQRRHRARAPVVLAGQPLVLPGQSRRRLDLGDRHGLADQDQDHPGLRRAAERHLLVRTARRRTSATTAPTGSASSTSAGTS